MKNLTGRSIYSNIKQSFVETWTPISAMTRISITSRFKLSLDFPTDAHNVYV
jgi:hypothetical protein